MEDGSIADNQLTASSTHPTVQLGWGRLHDRRGSWSANTDSGTQWFQVSFLPNVKRITDIATQGNGKSWWWVKTYYVMYRKGGEPLRNYEENNQRVVSNVLNY